MREKVRLEFEAINEVLPDDVHLCTTVKEEGKTVFIVANDGEVEIGSGKNLKSSNMVRTKCTI